MPGPFPGMDPYLENPARWYSAHNKLIAYMEAASKRVLPAPYVADSETRRYIGDAGDQIRPDISVIEQTDSVPPSLLHGVTAVMEATPPSLKVRVCEQEEIHEAFLNIVNMADSGRIVATIELLSHTNKTTRDKGRELYKTKQREVLASSTHLIEIDLLHSGRYTVAVPSDKLAEAHFDYLICLHRAQDGTVFDVWLNTLRETLPCIFIPLDAGVPDVPLDLQAVFDRNYDEGAYLSDLLAMGDKAYSSQEVKEQCAERNVRLLTLPRKNQKQQGSAAAKRRFNRMRQSIETVNGQLTQQFNVETNHAHSFWGLCTRLYARLTAHTLCIYINRLLGKTEFLQIKALAFPN